MKIIASNGKTFMRIHDGFIMGEEIELGVDYSTGVPREDKREYYEEIDWPERVPTYDELIEIANNLGVKV